MIMSCTAAFQKNPNMFVYIYIYMDIWTRSRVGADDPSKLEL